MTTCSLSRIKASSGQVARRRREHVKLAAGGGPGHADPKSTGHQNSLLPSLLSGDHRPCREGSLTLSRLLRCKEKLCSIQVLNAGNEYTLKQKMLQGKQTILPPGLLGSRLQSSSGSPIVRIRLFGSLTSKSSYRPESLWMHAQNVHSEAPTYSH